MQQLLTSLLTKGTALLGAALLLCAFQPVRAQELQEPREPQEGLIDALTLGVGLTIYQGDTDQNPDNSLIKYLGSGHLNLLVNVEKDLGTFSVGLDLTYDRFEGERRPSNSPATPSASPPSAATAFPS